LTSATRATPTIATHATATATLQRQDLGIDVVARTTAVNNQLA
jgi:hypothetical protein